MASANLYTQREGRGEKLYNPMISPSNLAYSLSMVKMGMSSLKRHRGQFNKVFEVGKHVEVVVPVAQYLVEYSLKLYGAGPSVSRHPLEFGCEV